MKSFVFMTRGGDLVEGHRVCLIDAGDEAKDLAIIEGHTVAIMKHDGWVMHAPNLGGGLPIFMNREIEKVMENLGEL